MATETLTPEDSANRRTIFFLVYGSRRICEFMITTVLVAGKTSHAIDQPKDKYADDEQPAISHTLSPTGDPFRLFADLTQNCALEAK